MKKKIVILTFGFAAISFQLTAQIVSGNCFIKGKYVELGIGPCGVFGTTVDAPAGYHPRGEANYPNRLGFVADQGKDGWNAGTPNYCGDYYIPGSPEEGFGITMNGQDYNNNLLCDDHDVPGSVISYANNGTVITGVWQGMINGLRITSKTSVPIDKLYFLTEVTMINTSPDTIRGLYYMRNIDPDNEVTMTGDYDTYNTIVNQNPNPDNKAVVTAEGLAFGCFIGLGTRDCRARVAWGGFTNRSAADAWNCRGYHQCSGSLAADLAITISFKLGDLPPGRQFSLKFVNVLTLADVDEAVNLTGPSFLIGGIPVNSNDTSQICSSGPTNFEVINTGGFDSWTWSPATGLNTTSGPLVICTGNIDTLLYTANGQNSCGSTIDIHFTAIKGDIIRVPKAGPIIGPKNVCTTNVTANYSIPPLSQAIKYTWHVPPGCSILSGDETNSITVNLGQTVNDSIWVYGINVCGKGDTALIRIRLLDYATPVLTRYTFAGDSITCEGQSPKLKAEYVIMDGVVTNFQWYKNNVVIPGATDSLLTVTANGTYKVEMTTSYGCNYITKDTALIFYPLPVAAFKVPDGCVAGSFTFTDTSNTTNGPMTGWIWKKNGEFFSDKQDPVANFESGLYNIQLTVRSDKGCWSAPASASFLRFGKPQADFSISGMCSDSVTQFNAITISPGYGNNSILNWTWDLGNNNASSIAAPSLIYGAAGYYDVNLSFSGDICPVISGNVARRIYVGDPLPAMKYNHVTAFEGDQFVLYGGNDGVSYSWFPATGLANPHNRVTTGAITQSQLYKVHVINSYGCGRIDSVEVVILTECKVYAPTAFTPNHDGLNDKFRIYFGCLKSLTRFTIFNRWGQPVFTAKDGLDSWDGTYKGVAQPGATYVWVAEGEFRSGKKFTEKGTVTLIR